MPNHDPSTLLRRALRANAWFSILSGLAFLIGADPIATFIDLDVPWMIRALGPGLLIYAFRLLKFKSAVALFPSTETACPGSES